MSVFRQRKTPDKFARYQSWQPSRLLLGCRKRMNGVYDKRALHRRKRAQTRISPLKLLHDEAVRRVAKTGAPVSFQIGRVEAQRAHARCEVFGELACTVERNNLRQNFLLRKTPCPIARCAFFIREKLFDVVIIQRGNASDSPSHARQFNDHMTQTQRSLSRRCRLSDGQASHFLVGNPAAFQALKPPAMERTFLYPIFCRLPARAAERPPPPQWQMIIAFESGTFSSMSSSMVPRLI